MKYLIRFFTVIFLAAAFYSFNSCGKKYTYYGVSDDVKEYFVFQGGSYWVYKDATTHLIDSTYITSYNHITDLVDYNLKIKYDGYEIVFNSQFIGDLDIYYETCTGPDVVRVSSILTPGQVELGGPISYFPGWATGAKIISEQCLPTLVFTCRKIQSDTINNVVYNNLIYNKIQSIDSALTNPDCHTREIYFAKNIGIIKFVENFPNKNIHRNLNLIRHKVIQ